MPTFTAIALDRLLEPGVSKSSPKSISDSKTVPNMKLERRNSTPTVATTTEKKHHWTQISPALYATPEVTPLPDSPTSFPPSPYIINHKRRGPRLLKSFSQADVLACKQVLDGDNVNVGATDSKTVVIDSDKNASVTVNDVSVSNSVAVEHVNGLHSGEIGSSDLGNGLIGENDNPNCAALNLERDAELDDFFDPRESMSYASNTDGEDNGATERSLKLTTPVGEFYDAWEELSSEGAPVTSLRDVEAELREIRLSLLMEIDKRKQAEEALNNLRSQWHRIREQLFIVGLTLPTDPTIVAEDGSLDIDPAEDICRQVYVSRFVSDTIGRGIAKAEVEIEMEAQIESKNFEIARLCDRLHYYESANREMSQRNQEAVEMARRHRQRRKRRQKWVWGSIAASITLGTAALAWSYLPTGKAGSSSSITSTDHSPPSSLEDAAN